MRLKDIVVAEVSLVDKAANKRKYAFMKRDETSKEAELQKTEEVKAAEAQLEAQKIKDAETVKEPEPTTEEIAQFNTLLTEYSALVAEVSKN